MHSGHKKLWKITTLKDVHDEPAAFGVREHVREVATAAALVEELEANIIVVVYKCACTSLES